MQARWITTLARVMERFVPDAITTCILLMVVLFPMALALGNTIADTINAYYKGLWMLLAFSMQMALILVLSLVLAATPLFRNTVIRLSRIPKTASQVVVMAGLLVAFIAYLNWGLAIALSPVVAIHFSKEAESKGIPIDFLWLMATMAGTGSVWQFGFSASAPLMVATPGHFLESITGVMPLWTTIWSPAAIALVLSFTVAALAVGCWLMPAKVRPISEFAETEQLAKPIEDVVTTALSPAQRMERSWFLSSAVCLALAGWLYHHFQVLHASLDINSVNTILLLLCFVLHGTVKQFTKALERAIVSSWPIVLVYHLYAGVAGLIQFTPVGPFLSSLANPILTKYTYPALTALISTVVAVFIPTSGGQWMIQGLITVKAAEAVGVTAQRGLLALSIGDHMGNLISPYWAVVGAGIARFDFRLFFGYRLIFAALWLVMGVLAFTLLPC